MNFFAMPKVTSVLACKGVLKQNKWEKSGKDQCRGQ